MKTSLHQQKQKGQKGAWHQNNYLVPGTLLLLLSFNGCQVAVPATSAYIENKIEGIYLGASRDKVRLEMGNPHFTTSIPHQNSEILVWGYEMGHYWYSDTVLVFFRAGRVIGVPRNYKEVFKLLHKIGILDQDTAFWYINEQ